MNGLTIAIYLAGIVDDVKGIFTVVAILASISSLVVLVVLGVTEGDINKTKHLTWLIPIAVVVGLFAAAIPDRDTVLLMAGSQVGEAVVTSPEGRELINDIKEVIHKQLEDLKHSSSDKS